MTASDDPQREETSAPRHHGTKGTLRGSSLLLVGRLISIGLNFFVQVLTVRYLVKEDFGALAWALAMTSMGASAVQMGLQRGLSRFVPIHQERGAYDEMFGTLLLGLGTVAGLGLALVVVVLGARGFLQTHVASSPLNVGLLLILIALVPLLGLDNLLQGQLAIFAGARAIFFRRYVLTPGLKLLAVLMVITIEGRVQLLAVSYVAVGAIGVAVYVLMLRQVLVRQQLLARLRMRHLKLPVRSLFSYSIPLLSTDLVTTFETTMVVLLLDRFRGNTEVAELRAVFPVAALCLTVLQSLKLLFRPQAARFFARGDEAGLSELYWRSAGWVSITSFPAFAACVFLAEPLTVFLFGERYATAGTLLAVLAAGKYFNAAMGLNAFTLQVYARVKLITLANFASAAAGLVAAFGLIPLIGALGAAIATTTTIVVRNVLYQVCLVRTTHVGVFPPAARAVYGSVLVVIALLTALRIAVDSVVVLAAAVIVATLLLVWLNRHTLDILNTFPELARVPVLRKLIGASAR